MKYLYLFFFLLIYTSTTAQISIKIVDSATRRPIVGAMVGIPSLDLVLSSDLEGKIWLPEPRVADDKIYISNLGYDKKIFPLSSPPETIYLASKSYQLKEAIIRAISAREYIELAFDSFQKNHVPESFKQRVFYREEFIVNNTYLRFQEMDMDIFQFPKTNDSRKFYRSGSYPEVKKIYRIDDHKRMSEVKYAVGKLIAKNINFNQFSLYSYAKGTNILNMVFTELLADDNATYKILADENIKGYNTVHIQGEHYSKNIILYTTHIYIEPQSMAVLHFSLLATEENVVRHWIDFKTKFLMWMMGIKIKVNKFYGKINFEKTNHNFWTVSDFTAMCPIEFEKKAKLDCYINMNYRMENKIETAEIPSPSLYSKNQTLFRQYETASRFGDQISYSIPLTPVQKERLKKIVQAK